MKNFEYKNERIKSNFLKHLGGPEEYIPSSVSTYARAISQWQEFTNNDDFYNFNKDIALEFRDWLKTRPSARKGETLSITTQHNYLRRVRKFFEWLADEPHKKKMISKNDVSYLCLTSKENQIVRNKVKKIPSLAEAKKLLQSISQDTMHGLRDRALIGLLIMTGVRVSAITSLKMKSFNKTTLCIYQDPDDGVDTKNSKYIETTFLPIEWQEPQEAFLEWYELMKSEGLSESDPLFPLLPIQTRKPLKNLRGSHSVGQILKKYCERAGIPYFTPHSFRHLSTMLFCNRKLSPFELKAVSVNMGHENLRTTLEVYGTTKSMSTAQATEIMRNMDTDGQNADVGISKDEARVLKNIIQRHGDL